MTRTTSYVALSLAACCLFMACSSDSGSEGTGGDELTSILMNYKWVLHTQEFNEYSPTELEYRTDAYYLYFTTETTGVNVTVTKIVDTFVDYNSRDVSHGKFTYTVSGNMVTIYFGSGTTILTYTNGRLERGDLIYEPTTITNSDRSYLQSISPQTGRTGSCTYTYAPETYELVISGSGAMADYNIGTQPWNDFVISWLDIDEGVTVVGANAFYRAGKGNINLIQLPNTLREIKAQAFVGIPLLEKIQIPKSVEIIGEAAFADCSKLKTLSLMTDLGNTDKNFSNLKTIESLAFKGCDIQNSVSIPNSVEYIGTSAFTGSYDRVTIGKSVKTIGDGAFNTSATTGKMYINRGTPPTAYNNLTRNDSRWTLYVPTGCKSAYQKASPWKNFKSIIEDSSLKKGND